MASRWIVYAVLDDGSLWPTCACYSPVVLKEAVLNIINGDMRLPPEFRKTWKVKVVKGAEYTPPHQE